MEGVCSLFNAHLNVNEFYHADKVGARGKWS